MDDTLHRPAGCLAAGPYELCLTPGQAGWSYAGLRVLRLPAGGSARAATPGTKRCWCCRWPGRPRWTARASGSSWPAGPGVFAGVTDFAYLPPGSAARIGSADGGRFALPSAWLPGAAAAGPGPRARYGAAAGVPVELRGAGPCSRQVNDFCMPGAFPADRLLACEVLTPAGNWSSYPPHKHDQDRPGGNRAGGDLLLRDRARATGPGRAGTGRASATSGFTARQTGRLDLLAEVRTGDVVLIPHGWHGPSMAAPGYDMYYLNVMAGPGRAGLADLRRPGARLGPGDLGRAAERTPGCRARAGGRR